MDEIRVILGDNFVTESMLRRQRGWLSLRKKYPHLGEISLFFYPLWILFIEGWADRPPFKPKRMEFVGYVDPFSYDSGLLDVIPKSKIIRVKPGFAVLPTHSNGQEEFLSRAVEKILTVDIRRLFALKMPRLGIVSKELMFLPCWKGTVNKAEGESLIVINCLNGRVEHRITQVLSSGAISLQSG